MARSERRIDDVGHYWKYSLRLSLMSHVGMRLSMQLFAGDLQIIFHTSSSVVFRRTFRVKTGSDCYFQVDDRAVREVIPNFINLFLKKSIKTYLQEEEFIHCLGHVF